MYIYTYCNTRRLSIEYRKYFYSICIGGIEVDMDESVLLDKEEILLHLDNYKLVVRIGDLTEGFYQHLLVREELTLRIDVLEAYMNELDSWEKHGDKERYDSVLCKAITILTELSDLIYQALDLQKVGSHSQKTRAL